MGTGTLTIHLDALRANWRALDAMTGCETSAVVKADGYGLGVAAVATALAQEGARTFFVAVAEEGAILRDVLGPGPVINVFSGHMPGDAAMLAKAHLVPMINSIEQMIAHAETLPEHPFGIQLDTGMNRLGMEPVEWAALRQMDMALAPALIMSHLACADEPGHVMNKNQLRAFREMTAGIETPLSLSNTGGILMGHEYHFDLTRPGIGTYGGLPFEAAQPVVQLDIPVIQCRTVLRGETVGYGNSYAAPDDRRVATISAGYADGIIRLMGPKTHLYAGEVACPVVGRISMDLIGVDVTEAEGDPDNLELLGPHQMVDQLAENAATIGYEILTSLGHRYTRRHVDA